METTGKWLQRGQQSEEGRTEPKSLEGLPKQRAFLLLKESWLAGIPLSDPLGYAKYLIKQETRLTEPHADRGQPES